MPLKRVQWRPYGTGVARFATLLSLVVATGPVVLGVAPSPAVAAPSYTLAERAMAIASPSLVYLETVYTGYVRDKQTNQPLLPTPITANRRCSGFVVNSEGDVATTRVCVSPPDDTVRQLVLYVAGFQLVSEGQLDRGQLDSWVSTHMGTTTITGQSEGSKPEAQLFAQFNIATGAVTEKPAIHGTVVKTSDPNDGNVALVKLDQGNLPAAEMDTKSTLSTGSQLTVLGFNTTDSDARVGTYTRDSKAVQVVGSDKLGAATYYRLNAVVGTYFHGGMAIDTTGRVVGIVDEDPTLPNNQNRAVYPISTIVPVLDAAGVHNTLSTSDKLFRSGLDAYFNGRYSTAISDLDNVTKTVPVNQVAPEYRQNAVDRQKIEGDASSGTPGWVILVVAAVGGALLATAALFLVLRARSRRRSRRRQETEWEPRYPFPPAPAVPVSGGEAPWVTPYGPVSAPPISGPPMPAPVSGSPMSAPPVSSSAPPYQPDPATTQAVSWPPPNAMPITPSTVDQPPATAPGPAPAEVRTADAWAPSPWTPDAAPEATQPEQVPPVPPTAEPAVEVPQPAEQIFWQQKPIRRRLEHDEEPGGGEQSSSPWAVPPSPNGG